MVVRTSGGSVINEKDIIVIKKKKEKRKLVDTDFAFMSNLFKPI